MSTQLPIGSKELPCPGCGYDLRARTGARCPECGMEVRDIVPSHIPWVHRRRLGRINAFVRTAALACFRPRVLTGDLVYRISGRAARQFHRACVWRGTAFMMAWVLVAVMFGDDPFRTSLPTGAWAGGSASREEFLFPAVALADSFWGGLPLFLSCYAVISMTAFFFRAFLVAFSGSPEHRLRVDRMAHYASAVVLFLMMQLGLVLALAMLADTNALRSAGASRFLGVVILVLSLGVIVTHVGSTVAWVWRTGRNRGKRLMLMLFVYPVVSISSAVVITGLTFWICGYLAMGIYSMLAR